ncbi:hypothetical protein HKX54_12475 [Sulfitobacter sp. M57]|uniref:hypothetical protein n=1 Tax=unclassified Sulfitobacter TaxID=196795 RepID=UPI0023E1A6D5|nr:MULTISPECIES: hypothetical protein [unclassified Sulfitobacter]MDF3415276.1 hypothetical protein [Sulfitobacter sp. KE5]MDF3422757.1 hypothetical protein [Sulfitobacter sp. KE43]MDF3433822.1 hypothetical protein [Sulfitobacter sp. KE42]MDF3459462.1 hypothetical protein [Sulfitobacter sp. S74]MDF3463361.1 hypothetical protein [Sulfitobacter sp. Ks18]
MSQLQLTKTKMKQGVWQGIITGGVDEDKPHIEVTHENTKVPDLVLTHNQSADHWTLSVPIPPEAIADGVQTLIIRDVEANEKIGHITLIAGEALADDIRAEMNLLRAELDMLKSAFRRHCVETT